MNDDHHDVENWLSLEEAAEQLGNTPLNVLMHLKRGLLAGTVVEGTWLIAPDSLAALVQKRREGEVPAVCQSGCGKAGGCGDCK